MKKLYYLIILTVILSLVLTGCFLSNVGQVPTSEQSGITYLTKATEGDPLVTTLFAGQDINVGTVSVWNGINEVLGVECLYVKYETTGGWVMTETHLAVATSLDDIPQTKKHNPIPGQFPYKHEDLDFATADEYIIPLSEIDEEVECEDIFYIAAQASLQNLNNPEFVETVTVNADNPLETCSIVILESGKKYLLKASETAFACATIEFDAKYSVTGGIGNPWTDLVTGYEIHGPDLLGLAVDGEFVDWGGFKMNHVYDWDMTGEGSCVALWIYDLPGSYGNNSGFLTVDIYLYQEESAWAVNGVGDEFIGKKPFGGRNWATYFTYGIENLLPTISSEDLAGPYVVGKLGEFSVTTVNQECGFDYPAVLFNYTIYDFLEDDIVSFEYYDEDTDAWYDAGPTQDGSDVVGHFGNPTTGFPMGPGYNKTTKFEIIFKTTATGTYNVVIILNNFTNNVVLATLTEDVVVSPGTVLAVGDSYGGGKVAYILQVDDPGYVVGEQHGLVAATNDQSARFAWITGGDTQTTWVNGVEYGGTSTDYGTGQANTNAMMAQTGYTGGAAKVCDDYTNTETDTGVYSDWFLPSKDELNKLWLNKAAIGGFADVSYWSSSENNAPYAWYQVFYDSYGVDYNNKYTTYRVRAVRAF